MATYLTKAQLLRPWILAVLLILTLFTNQRVNGLITYSSSELINIGKTARQVSKDSWTANYKSIIKSTEPTILRSKKRGKRSGIRTRLTQKSGNPALPGILLTNARSILPKIDELFAIIKNRKHHQLTQVISITESWLTDKVPNTSTHLDGYMQFRNDRSCHETGKTKGGGILVYINESWSTNNQEVFKHSSRDLEILTIKSRPFWLPRELQSIIMVSVYCPQTGKSQLASSSNTTIHSITEHLADMEAKHQSSAIILMGDFNNLKLKLPNYQQVVSKPTRGCNILDKCYVNIRNAYPYCKRLGQLGNSDHNIIQLLSGYKHRSSYKPSKVMRRQYTTESSDKLKHCFETTTWDSMIQKDEDISLIVPVLNSYINFCTDLHIPARRKLVYHNNKPWIDKRIIQLVKLKHQAAKANDRKLYHKLKRDIGKAIKHSRRHYTKRIQEQMANQPARAWNDIKKICGLTTDAPLTQTDACHSPDELNTFFARFENTSHERGKSNTMSQAYSPISDFNEEEVERHLRQLNGRKGPGPDGIIPRVVKMCSKELAPIITLVFNASVTQSTIPDIWKTAMIRPIPKVPKPQQLKDFRPIAITSCLIKVLEKLVKKYVVQSTRLDPLQFAYRAGRSTQDALLMLLTTVTTFIDARASNYSRCLFLDFSSAFNTINVDILLGKLAHLDPKIAQWISSFLTNRVQFVATNSKRSAPIITNTGTPQGTVLSPLLFSIYTNALTSTSPSCSVFKYADDTVLVGNIAAPQDFKSYELEVDRICALCRDHDLILNVKLKHRKWLSLHRESPLSWHLCL